MCKRKTCLLEMGNKHEADMLCKRSTPSYELCCFIQEQVRVICESNVQISCVV